jgi:ComF family protein
MHILKKILDCLWPRECIICRTDVKKALPLCPQCLINLPWNHYACRHCGVALNAIKNSICGQCLLNPPAYRQLISPFKYQEPVMSFITRLKFHHQLRYANLLGNLLANYIALNYKDSLPQLLIPVPLHRKRWCERGFNQAYEIAKPVGKILKIPINIAVCKRIKNTLAQSSLTTNARKSNIKKAFVLKQAVPINHIALIDDVVTTGYTIQELVGLFKSSGVQTVDVWCCARARLLHSKPQHDFEIQGRVKALHKIV